MVGDADELVGCVTARDVKELSPNEWNVRTVDDVAKPCSDQNTVTPEADALKVLTKMRQTGLGRLLVADRGRLLAIVSMRDLLNFLAAKLDIEDVSGSPKLLPGHGQLP